MTHLTRFKIRAVAAGLALAWGGGTAFGYIVFHDSAVTPTDPAYHMPKQAQTYDQAAFLMKLHHCWSGQAPADMAGEIPGHSVVTPYGRWPVYAGSKLTGEALDQLFGGVDHRLTVHGFCR